MRWEVCGMAEGTCGIVVAAAAADFIVNVTCWIGQQPPRLLLLYSSPLIALWSVLCVWSCVRVARQRRSKVDEYYAEIRDRYKWLTQGGGSNCYKCETRGDWRLEEKEGRKPKIICNKCGHVWEVAQDENATPLMAIGFSVALGAFAVYMGHVENGSFSDYTVIGPTVVSSLFLLFGMLFALADTTDWVLKLFCGSLIAPILWINAYLYIQIGRVTGGIGSVLSKVGLVVVIVGAVLIGYRLLDVVAAILAYIAAILKWLFGPRSKG